MKFQRDKVKYMSVTDREKDGLDLAMKQLIEETTNQSQQMKSNNNKEGLSPQNSVAGPFSCF